MGKRGYFTLLPFVFFLSTTYGQSKVAPCDCPETPYTGTKADTAFHLSNGRTIVLCGYKDPDLKPTAFSEFVLSVCGQDTILGFWGAVLTCRLKVDKDTLLIEELQNFPIGKNFKNQEAVWKTEKFYFDNQKVCRKIVINRQIRKYTKAEIKSILSAYETAKFGIDDSKLILANQLFIATISGNKQARQYFKDFEKKFGALSGELAETYHGLAAMLVLWDQEM